MYGPNKDSVFVVLLCKCDGDNSMEALQRMLDAAP